MPLFISFEGPEGSGKSTQVRLLAGALRARGYPVTETREPGGTSLGEAIRHVVLDPDAPPATPLAMALLLSAARAELVSEVILPALRGGQLVLTDRFADSTIAYQSYGLGLPIEDVRELTRIATGGLLPDIVFYVDVSPRIGWERITARGAGNWLDGETRAFHQRVRSGYQELIAADPERWIVIDGDASPQAVHAAIVRALEPRLPRLAGAL